MSLLDLGALYLLGGVVCSVAIWRRSSKQSSTARRLASALVALPLWPLWAPFALTDPDPRPQPRRRRHAARSKAAEPAGGHDLAGRIERALYEAVEAAEGTSFGAMLNAEAATRMAGEMRRACERLVELQDVLAQPEFNFDRAKQKAKMLEDQDASTSAARTARMHLDNIERLMALGQMQADALTELEQALGALHSQLVVARYAGSTSEGVDAIVSDLWARVEGLGEALESDVVTSIDSAPDCRPATPPSEPEPTAPQPRTPPTTEAELQQEGA